MRAVPIDDENRRVLADGRETRLTCYRLGWAASLAGPFHDRLRVRALVVAGLMDWGLDGDRRPRAWTTQAGRMALDAACDAE